MTLSLPPTLSDHPSLVGIVRFPQCTITTNEVPIPTIIKVTDIIPQDTNGGNTKFSQLIQKVDMATTINGSNLTSQAYNIPKTKVTDFYPYSYYVLTDGECEPLILFPQYLPNSLTIKGNFALSNQPIERYYPNSYKGDTTGAIYNITNTQQMMLPTATNEGISYLNANSNAMAQGRKTQITGNILNAINVVASAVTTQGKSLIGGGVTSVIGGIADLKNADARNKDIMLTPSTISSFGTPSTRQAFGTDKVRLIRFTVKDEVKNKINSFCERYGNKYNNFATIDIKTYKGYVKYISPKISSGIDNMFIEKIREIFERGVYIE